MHLYWSMPAWFQRKWLACSPEWSAWVNGDEAYSYLSHHIRLYHRSPALSFQSCSDTQEFGASVCQQADAADVAAAVADDDNHPPSFAHPK